MLVGLSGAASTASGFGFTGLIGFGYMVGFSAVWFLLGAFISIGLSLLFFSKRFRVYSKKMKYLSYTEFLAFGVTKRGASKATVKPDRSQKTFQIMLSLLSLFIVVLYAAAQLAAGSKSLYVIFDWPYESGAILGAVIVLLYCWAGGIRASIWTDAVQIIVMMLAMVILAGFAIRQSVWSIPLYNRVFYIWYRAYWFSACDG
jgi:sodium/proline symporter